MDKLETQMEQALQDAGFTITDTMPGSPEDAPVQEMQQAPVAPATESEPQQVVESAQPVQQAAPVEDQPVTQEVIEPINQPEQGSLNNENEGFETFFNALMGETPPAQGETTASQSISPELDLDPRIQVIADFVDKTGRSPEDWFRYQALDPSEMDSEKARQSVESLREAYTLPSQEASNVAQPDSPFDTDWFRSNAQSLTELSEIAFELPGDREFNYGVKADYRNELARDNGNMTEFFDKYVDPKGESKRFHYRTSARCTWEASNIFIIRN